MKVGVSESFFLIGWRKGYVWAYPLDVLLLAIAIIQSWAVLGELFSISFNHCAGHSLVSNRHESLEDVLFFLCHCVSPKNMKNKKIIYRRFFTLFLAAFFFVTFFREDAFFVAFARFGRSNFESEISFSNSPLSKNSAPQ